MHYYKRNLGDYAKKTGRLTMLQHGAYTLLIDSCYDRERFPTFEQAVEWTWASTEAEIEAVKFVLSRFFTLGEDGEYVQERILAELLEYHSKADKNKQIAIDRETKRREMRTNRAPDVHEPPPNHKPLTNNHKPVTNNHKPISSVSKDTGDKSPMTTDEIIFGYGLPLLTNAGTADKQARSFLGGLRKTHGDESVVNALRDCIRVKPLQPLEWMAKALPPTGKQKLNKQEALEASNRAVVERLLKKEGLL